MRNNLIHIYAVCPQALATTQLTHYFGPQHCRFLDPVPLKKYRITHDWLGNELTQSEIQLLKDIKAKLYALGAIRNTSKLTVDEESNDQPKVLQELKRENTKLTLAIVPNESPISKEAPSIVQVNDFLDKNLFTLEPIDLFQSPKAFFDHIPEFIIQDSNKFKLIDPYIYEMKSTQEAYTRLDFIFELIKQYRRLNGSEEATLNIRIFGRKPKNYSGHAVKGHIINAIKQENLEHTMIEFFVLGDNVTETDSEYYGKKFHERFFCADLYYFNFEDSSQNRSDENSKQTWRAETSKTKRAFIDGINEKAQIFKLIENFNSNELRLGDF